MKLDKAIELNTETTTLMNFPDLKDKRDAILLGIEALKRELKHRQLELTGIKILLPGETEE